MRRKLDCNRPVERQRTLDVERRKHDGRGQRRSPDRGLDDLLYVPKCQFKRVGTRRNFRASGLHERKAGGLHAAMHIDSRRRSWASAWRAHRWTFLDPISHHVPVARFRSTIVPSIAIALLTLASLEMVFYADCSNLSSDAAQSASQPAPGGHSGDDCLCCCGHLVVAAAFHVEPVTMFASVPEPQRADKPIARHSPVYRPPRA